ncbi:MAG TPA: glycoside hydrolase family 76 protein [Ktedonobacteraceae bacterium]
MPRTVKLVEEGFSTFSSKFHRGRGLVVNAIALLVLISLELTTIFVGTNPALAAPIFTSSDQDQAISSFISAFYDPTNHFFYTDTQNHAEADLWTEAVDWDIVMDAYKRTKNSTYNQMIGDIYNHVTSVYGANCGQWQVPNASNNTLAWWAQASLQAYTITNTTTYRDCAKAFFDKLYQSWDTTQAGGGIWTLNNQTTQKNMATNALAVMTAAQLSTLLGNSTYLSDAQGIYNWMRARLTNLTGTSGAVYDRYDNTSNTIIMDQFSDNYGLFIGAALALYDATKSNSSTTNNQSVNYLADANNVANASLTNVTIDGDGIIQYESDCNNHTATGDTSNSLSGNNGNIANDGSFVDENNTCTGGTNERALYKGIYAHYLADLAFNSNHAVSQSAAYGQVLDENAAIALNDRRPSDNLVGADWTEPAPTGPIKSWEAASAVEILQDLPNNNNIGTYQSQDATLQGGLSLATQFTGFLSNSGYINAWNQNNQTVSYTVTAPAAGTNLLIMHYAAGSGNAMRYLQVNSNQNTANFPTGPIYSSGTSNSVVAQISFPGTNNWNTYDLAVIPALLTQGNNTITLSFNSSQNSQNSLNLDELTVTPGFPPPPVASSSSSATPTPTPLTPTPIANVSTTIPSAINNIASSGSNTGKSGNSTASSGSNTGKSGNITPTPTPRPIPTPIPTPVPTATPKPVPTTAPVPSPTTAPVPSPTTAPVPSPTTVPVSSPTTAPVSSPTTVPVSSPTIAPISSPTTAPISSPTTAPVPAPVPSPTIAPVLSPTTAPVPSPTTAPVPAPVPSPTTAPVPTPKPTPVSTPVPTPKPTPVSTPVPTPKPTPVSTPVPTPTS